MSCPYFLCSKHGSCKVFDGLYQPRQQEKQLLCQTDDYNDCEIYHYYETTCEHTSFAISPEMSETTSSLLS